jgi:hypothetical protein
MNRIPLLLALIFTVRARTTVDSQGNVNLTAGGGLFLPSNTYILDANGTAINLLDAITAPRVECTWNGYKCHCNDDIGPEATNYNVGIILIGSLCNESRLIGVEVLWFLLAGTVAFPTSQWNCSRLLTGSFPPHINSSVCVEWFPNRWAGMTNSAA